jgi:hypothetical protein
MELFEQLETVRTRDEFIAFLNALAQDAAEYRQRWAHEPPAQSFFAVIAARLPGMPDRLPTYDATGPILSEQPTWRDIAELFFRAREAIRRPPTPFECPNCRRKGVLETDFWRVMDWAFCKPCVLTFVDNNWVAPQYYPGWEQLGQPSFQLTERGTAALPGLEVVSVCNADGMAIYRCWVEAGVARAGECPYCLGLYTEMQKAKPIAQPPGT